MPEKYKGRDNLTNEIAPPFVSAGRRFQLTGLLNRDSVPHSRVAAAVQSQADERIALPVHAEHDRSTARLLLVDFSAAADRTDCPHLSRIDAKRCGIRAGWSNPLQPGAGGPRCNQHRCGCWR